MSEGKEGRYAAAPPYPAHFLLVPLKVLLFCSSLSSFSSSRLRSVQVFLRISKDFFSWVDLVDKLHSQGWFILCVKPISRIKVA